LILTGAVFASEEDVFFPPGGPRAVEGDFPKPRPRRVSEKLPARVLQGGTRTGE